MQGSPADVPQRLLHGLRAAGHRVRYCDRPGDHRRRRHWFGSISRCDPACSCLSSAARRAAPVRSSPTRTTARTYRRTGCPALQSSARLDFALSPSDCPRVATPDVTTAGEGSAVARAVLVERQGVLGRQAARPRLHRIELTRGARQLSQGLDRCRADVDRADRRRDRRRDKRKFTTAPIDLTGVVVAFNVSDTGDPRAHHGHEPDPETRGDHDRGWPVRRSRTVRVLRP